MIIPYAIKPFIPNLKTITTNGIQGNINKIISANLNIDAFCSVTYGWKASENYQTYEDISNIEKLFAQKTNQILGLMPKQVKDFKISKQLLHLTKGNITNGKISTISLETKRRFLAYFDSLITVQIMWISWCFSYSFH